MTAAGAAVRLEGGTHVERDDFTVAMAGIVDSLLRLADAGQSSLGHLAAADSIAMMELAHVRNPPQRPAPQVSARRVHPSGKIGASHRCKNRTLWPNRRIAF